MKIQEKQIMGPLLVGGLIISLYFTISTSNRISVGTAKNLAVTPLTARHTLQNDAPAFCIRMIKKFITN